MAVVGSEEFVVGFRLAGIRRVYGVSEEQVEPTITKILDAREVGILAVSTQALARLSPSLRKRIEETVEPVVIPVGHEEGELRDKVRRAIGIDLYRT